MHTLDNTNLALIHKKAPCNEGAHDD